MIPRLALYGIAGAALIAIAAMGSRWLVKTGERLQAAETAVAQAKYDQAQAERLRKANDGYRLANQGLQERLQGALANPVTRTIRVRVPASCAAPEPTDASVPTEHPTDGLFAVDDPDYGRLRAWLLQYAAGPAASGSRTDAAVPDSR